MRPFVLFRAVVLSGLAAGLSVAVIVGPGLYLVEPWMVGDLPTALLLTGLVGSVHGLIAAAVLGLATHAVLIRIGRPQALGYVLVGLVGGCALSLLFAWGNAAYWFMVVAGAFAGALGGYVFWRVVRVDQPTAESTS